MQEYIIVTGIILKQSPVGEYDRHISVSVDSSSSLSEGGPGNSPLTAIALHSKTHCTRGLGRLFAQRARSSYTLAEADIQNYFEELRTDYEGACYGMYFAEVAVPAEAPPGQNLSP